MKRRAIIVAGVAFAALATVSTGPAHAGPVARPAVSAPDDPAYGQQWNFHGSNGIRLPAAWKRAARRGAPGGRGATVAVLDTGVAYTATRDYGRAPDLGRVVAGHDFVAGDRVPLDENGHGTHVAGTIAQLTDNGIGAAGIAYRATIMPVRVLDARGQGDATTVARGIRWAARRRADVINLSFDFSPDVTADDIAPVTSALAYARRRGAVVVASSGNDAGAVVAYPARAADVIAVGATTERGCVARYSNGGPELDIVAPGGGADAADPDNPACRPGAFGRPILQQTFTVDGLHFGLPGGRNGTSFAAPHVSGAAALLIAANRAAGVRLTPAAVEQRLETTARDLGPAGWDARYGAGLLDAAAALG